MLQQKNNWILKRWQVPPVKAQFLNFMEFVVMSENPWSLVAVDRDPKYLVYDPDNRVFLK